MRVVLGYVVLIVAGLTATAANAQLGGPWDRRPTVMVIGAASDPRLRLVEEAVAFWNTTLEAIGSGFPLGPGTTLVHPVPEDALQSLSRSIAGVGPRRPIDVPQA